MYGGVLLLDGTYNVVEIFSLPLYTLLAVDNFGVGQPVAYFFVRDETAEGIGMGLKNFCDVSFILTQFPFVSISSWFD